MKFRNFSFLIFCFLVLPSLVAAADFVSMVGIPGIPDNSTDLNQYFNAVYRLSISLAALLAVVKIVMAGAKYMLTDIVPAKGEALADIKGALLGLLVILAAVLILGTINKNILNTDLTFTEVATDSQPATPQDPVDPLQAACDAGGGCETVRCADLQSWIASSLMGGVPGVYIGSVTGMSAGSFIGSFIPIPVVGTLVGAGTGFVIGSVVGGTIAYIGYNSAQAGQCSTACTYLGGINNLELDNCTIPNDKIAFAKAELMRNQQNLRQACFSNPNDSGCCNLSGGIINFENETCSKNEQINLTTPTSDSLQAMLNCSTEQGGIWDYVSSICRSGTPVITINPNVNYTATEDGHTEAVTISNEYSGHQRMVLVTYSDGESRPVSCDQVNPPVCNVHTPINSQSDIIIFNNNIIDTSHFYNIFDGAFGNEPAGPDDGKVVTIIGTNPDGRINIRYEDDGRVLPIGCDLLIPTIPGCSL